MRNRFGVFSCFHKHQSEELPGLQERWIGRMRSFDRLDGGTQRPDAVMRESQVHPRRSELWVNQQRTLVG